jgi:hypothetical protein
MNASTLRHSYQILAKRERVLEFSSLPGVAVASDSTIIGAAGEHYAMCQLLRRGMIAALAPAGVPNADIVVTDRIGARLCAIQVKARREVGSDGGWHMKPKHEELSSPSLFYCFVDFGASLTDQTKCWVVPSFVVSRALSVTHQAWLSLPGRNGQPHKDSNVRRLLPHYKVMETEYPRGWLDRYYEAWSLLDEIVRS